MRILFVVPPWRTTDALTANLYPLPYAPVVLAAILEQAGHKVTINDFLADARKTPAPTPDTFAGKRAPAYLHYGTPLNDAFAWLRVHGPEFDAVGVFLGQCNLYETGAAIVEYIRNVVGRPVVVGGAFASTAPDEVYDLTGADVIVQGEAEAVVEHAFEIAAAGISGARIVGDPVRDLDAFPLPAWHLVDLSKYPRVGSQVRGVLSIARGCPHACKFCSVHTVHGRKVRRKGPDRVRAEILQLWNAGVRYFTFLDDNLFVSSFAADDLLGIIDDLRATVPGFKAAKFYNEEGLEIRMAAMPGLVARMIAAGFVNIALGIETMNDDARRAIAKPYTPAQLSAALSNCEAAGVVPRALYIVGLPGDTIDSVCRDLVALGQYKISARPNNLKLYPGTETTAEYAAQGWIDPTDFDWRLSTFWTPPSTGLDYATIRALKTELGAIGHMAAEFGVALFADPVEDIFEAMRRRRFIIDRDQDGRLTVNGPIFRSTPYRHAMELLVIRAGAAGARSFETHGGFVVEPLPEPANSIQAGILKAIGRPPAGKRSTTPDLFDKED